MDGSGNGVATSEMKHNGLRKRLDVLGFTQPLPLGAVPLVGAILEDLIRTTETLKGHKDQVHNLLQEKKAWDLGVEAYKCDNSKLLSEVSQLNKELMRQRDQYEAKKVEFSRRIRNLEMDKKYLEDHLQQMGERFEELEGKYHDVLDPKRKSSRKPFVSTVKSGCIIDPPARQHQHHYHHQPCAPCPSRCPASARRRDLERERDHLRQETVTLQETIDMQSKQIEARDREIGRVTLLLSTEGRPAKALAEDCCYRNVKKLHDDINHLQRENTSLKGKLLHCGKTTVPSRADERKMKDCECEQAKTVAHTCEDQLKECKLAAKSCDEVHRELKEKDKIICELQQKLCKGKIDENNVDTLNELSDVLADRVKLQESYTDKLMRQEKVLKQASVFNMSSKANCENEPSRYGKVGGEVSHIQREIQAMRKQLEDLSVFNQREDCLRGLRSQLALKESEINTIKNRSCLSASSMFNSNKCESDRSWKDSCHVSGRDKMCLERDHSIMVETMQRLECERDHLKYELHDEITRFRIEREAFNNTLEKLRIRLKDVETQNCELLAKQEPKNAAITAMQAEVKSLRCQIDIMRSSYESLQSHNQALLKETRCKDQALKESKMELSEMEVKLKQSTRQLMEHGSGEQKLVEDLERVNSELRNWKENCEKLEEKNARLSKQLCERMEELRKFRSEYNHDKDRLVKDYESMKMKFKEQIDLLQQLEYNKQEMRIQIDTYQSQIKTLRKELETSTKSNKNLADQLSQTECDLSNMKRMLTESQMCNDEHQIKVKEYMLELTRVEKLLGEKEKERDELLENMKKVSVTETRMRGTNITLSTELCQNKRDLEEANKRIRDLRHIVETKEKEMCKLKETNEKSLGEVLTMRSELDKAYEAHKKMHDDSVGLRKARQEMIMSIERLKNELETWKTLHDEMKSRNDKLKRELQAVKCDEHPQNVNRLQELLAQNRDQLDTQIHKIASLSSELAMAKEELFKFKQALEEEKCKKDDPLKRYVDKVSELERMTSRDLNCCDNKTRDKVNHVSITTPIGTSGIVRRASDPYGNVSVTHPKCACGVCSMTLDTKALVVTAPGQLPLVSDGRLTIRKQCPNHPDRVNMGMHRSKSYHGHKAACVVPSQRHQSCSPARDAKPRQNCPFVTENCSHKSPRERMNVDSNAPLDKLCAELNMSGLMNVPEPPPPMKESGVCDKLSTDTSTHANVNRFLDDVRKHGQSKRHWSTSDEIEALISSQKHCGTPGRQQSMKRDVEMKTCPAPAAPQESCNKPCAAVAPMSRATDTPIHQSTPVRRLEIPRRTLVDSFVPKEQPKTSADGKKIDDETFKPAESNPLEKGFNTVMAELKSFTHQLFSKPDEVDHQTCGDSSSLPAPENVVLSDTVKQRIQRFQEIVNDANRNIARPIAVVKPTPRMSPAIQQPSGPESSGTGATESNADSTAVPPEETEEDKEQKPSATQTQQPGLIRRVIDSIAQGGIQGLSTLHREPDEVAKKIEEIEKNAVEHEKSELLNYSREQREHTLRNIGTPLRGTMAMPYNRATPAIGRITPRRIQPFMGEAREATPAHIPTVELSPLESGTDDGVIDLTESLRGGQEGDAMTADAKSSEQSPMDSDVEYISERNANIIHTVSSATRNGTSQRSTAHDADDRFQDMIHREPHTLRHEEYNNFVKQSMANARLSSSSDDYVPASPRKTANRLYDPNARRGTIAYRANQYAQHNSRLLGGNSSTHDRAAYRNESQSPDQDDGCADEDLEMSILKLDRSISNRSAPFARMNSNSAQTSTRTSSKTPFHFRDQFVDHIRGHDSGPSLPFSSLLSRDTNFDFSGENLNHRGFGNDYRLGSSSGTMRSRNVCRGGLAGGSPIEEDVEEDDEDEDNYEDDDEEEEEVELDEVLQSHDYEEESQNSGSSHQYDNYAASNASTTETPQTFSGPYYGSFDADDNLRNLNLEMAKIMSQEPVVSRQMTQRVNPMRRDFNMNKFVGRTSQNLDGLQSSVEVLTNDERSVSGHSVESQNMRFICSISKSMDGTSQELNVNLMLLSEDEDGGGATRSVTPSSCMSESTRMDQPSKISVEEVYLSYSRPEMSESMLLSLCENDLAMGGGESTLTALMDAQGKGTGKEFKLNDEMITQFLDEIMRSNDLLTASDELSLATVSAPDFP